MTGRPIPDGVKLGFALGLLVVGALGAAFVWRMRAPAEPSPTAAVGIEADRIWTERCATCHGTQGWGDGPVAPTLSTKPRDFRDAVFQQDHDEEIEAVIIVGGKAMGYSDNMPPNPDLARRPDVVQALIAKIRRIGGR